MIDTYESLANAIILLAVKDYRSALNLLKKHPYNTVATHEKQKLECFFRSDMFSVLTGIDPEMLIHKLRKEVA